MTREHGRQIFALLLTAIMILLVAFAARAEDTKPIDMGCYDPYPSWSVWFHGPAGPVFSSMCFRQRAACEIANMGASTAFAYAEAKWTATCDPQPARKK